jgi:hypothetical protein
MAERSRLGELLMDASNNIFRKGAAILHFNVDRQPHCARISKKIKKRFPSKARKSRVLLLYRLLDCTQAFLLMVVSFWPTMLVKDTPDRRNHSL